MSEKQQITFICRACLLVSNDAHPIFENNPSSGGNICTMLEVYSIQISENDNLPKTFCTSCLNKLQAGYDFVETYKKSEAVLMQQQCDETVHKVIVVKDIEEYRKLNGTDLDADDNVTILINNPEEIAVEEAEGNVTNSVTDPYSEDEDDEDFLIEQSVKLTKLQQLQQSEEVDLEGSDDDDDDDGGDDENVQSFLIEDESTEDTIVVNSESNSKLALSQSYNQCPICLKSFIKFKQFYSHVSQHSSEMTCKICHENFDSASTFLHHYEVTHRYQCDICMKSFPRSDTYNRHMHAHNNTLPQYRCPVENCSRTFAVKQSLRNHYKTLHCDKSNFLCNLCGVAFKNYGNLRYHLKKHSGPSHLCTYCGKTYMQAVHLKYHMWRHTGVKPYKCSKCDKTFLSKKALHRHVLRNCKNRKRVEYERTEQNLT